MIKEQYVSFEVAKLLKDKRFDEEVHAWHNIFDKTNLDFSLGEAPYCNIPAPTQQMAMRWLREVHNIIISIYPFNRDIHSTEVKWYTCDIATPTLSSKEGHLRGVWKEYEETCEEAIKYCLENLI